MSRLWCPGTKRNVPKFLVTPEGLDMEDNDVRGAKTYPSELAESLEELKALLEHLKGEDLSEDTMALFLGRLRIFDLVDDVPMEPKRPAVAGPFRADTMGGDLDEIDAFLGECRSDQWFQDHPE